MTERIPPKPSELWKVLVPAGAALFLGLYVVIESTSYFVAGGFIPGWPQDVVLKFLGDLARGAQAWRIEHTISGIGVFLLLVAVALGVVWLWTRKGPVSTAQRASKRMSQGSEMSVREVQERTSKGRLTSGEVLGVLVAQTMKGLDRIADWRSTMLIIMGPGAGKTTGESIPIIMDAPGVVFATTNKRDLPDAIRGAKDGSVWVFDPQRICSKSLPPFRLEFSHFILPPGEAPEEADEVRAHKLAKVWMDASGPANAKRDAYFDSAGPNLLSGLLLACAISGSPLSQMYKWLMKPKNTEPITILEEHGKLLPALALGAVYEAPEEQKAGVFGTAAEMVSFLNNSRVRAWLEPLGPDDDRPVFSPERFVRSGDETFLALSKEGIGSTGPLTAALTVWVLDAAEEFADEHEHGRLAIPFVVVLDEAANVCRIQELPNLYSHYGSRGIFPVTILQTWSQGVRVWGEDGMKALWGASTVRVIGAGQADTTFLKMISDLTGEFHQKEVSQSSGKGSNSRSISHPLRPILSVDDLSALKLGEVWVQTSGGRPFVGRTVPWHERPGMQTVVAASISKYEPKSQLPVTV